MITNHQINIPKSTRSEAECVRITERVLYIMQLPPPVHGSNLMNKSVYNSKLLNQHFLTDLVNLKFSKSSRDIEKFTFQKLFKVGYYALLIIKKIILHKPDLIYFTMAPRGFAFYRDGLYIFILKTLRQNIVLHLHGKGIKKTADRNILNKWICKALFKKVHVISLSNQLTEDIRDFCDSTPFIIPNGIANPVFSLSYIRTKNTIPQILFLSNYIQEKGILVLLDALYILNKKGYDFSARLVGAPGDISIEYLEKYLHDHQLAQKIVVVGPKYDQDKIVEFQQADIFVFPTFYSNEAFPLVNLEAMQYSLPIISTDEGGISDMLRDSDAGFIVKAKDPEALANKIAILLIDKDLREQMGNNAFHHFSNNYTLDRFEANMKRVFDQAI
ncbi:MAG: glycosyltransferase family 4 protein [Saprospiraceae bacterium]|nr:glycosyltransferase family 4 protein [Saprospiraceae bacterium]